MESLKIKEVRRNLHQNREKFRYDLQYMCKLFEVDSKSVLKNYDSLSDEFIKYHIQRDELDKKINDVSYGFEKLKLDFISKNDIDIRDKILNSNNGEKILDELWKIGFVSNDMFEVIKDEIWRKRKTQNYEFAKWLQYINIDFNRNIERNKENRFKMSVKRRFNSKDFEYHNNDKVIDMDDMKKMFREYVVYKMEKDFEEMIKKYLSKKL